MGTIREPYTILATQTFVSWNLHVAAVALGRACWSIPDYALEGLATLKSRLQYTELDATNHRHSL